MSINTLMSAAHAAGFAMAAEDVAEPPPPPVIEAMPVEAVPVEAVPVRPALPARIPQSLPAPLPPDVLRMQRALRRLWLRWWLAGPWGGRAAA